MEETVALERAHAEAHDAGHNGSGNGHVESTGDRELVSGRPKDIVD
jgi:hypothetical protein